nr:immunoglobulin light chain junction region [Macaca mulatta]
DYYCQSSGNSDNHWLF